MCIQFLNTGNKVCCIKNNIDKDVAWPIAKCSITEPWFEEITNN